MLLRPRPLRTYSRRDGYLRLLPPPEPWLSPPLDRRNLFSSSSAASSAVSAASSASSSAAPDDPDYSPPRKRCPWSESDSPAPTPRLRPRRRRRSRGRQRDKEESGPRDRESGPRDKENRPRDKENGPRDKENRPRDKENRPRDKENRPPPLASPCPFPPPHRGSPRRRRRGPGAGRAPLLCSTPAPLRSISAARNGSPARSSTPVKSRSPVSGTPAPAGGSSIPGGSRSPQPPARPRRPAPPLLSSSSSTTGGDSVSVPRHSPPGRRRGLRLRSLLLSTEEEEEEEEGEEEQQRPAPAPRRRPPLPPSSSDSSAGPGGAPRPSRRGSRWAGAAPTQQDAPGQEEPGHGTPGQEEPGQEEPGHGTPGQEEPQHPPPRRSAAPGAPGAHRPAGPGRGYQRVPVVVLDPHEVSARLAAMRLGRREGAAPAAPRAAPAEGSACRRGCISGLSGSRWRSLRPRRRRTRRQQQQHKSRFSRARARRKPARKGLLETSGDVRDNESSFLGSSCTWARLRASLSFHKKKKVTADDSFCSSILSSPAGNSPLSGYQASLSSGKAQGPSSCASSMGLLAPGSSADALELTLTDAEKVFGECHQDGPVAFGECFPLERVKGCKKIGEGVFGEVFQINSQRGPVALKVIPIEGTEKVNGEAQKSFGEILPEVIISKELSLLSEESVNRTVGFISLYSVHCVQGAYPKYLLKAWDEYDKETGSENDRPDFFGDQQLFMVLEFEFGGSDLEHVSSSLGSVAAARSILHQVTASLAVAEQELRFEHRDLHWGNVLVKTTDAKALHYVLNGASHEIPTAGIHVNIIDYTLSRLEKDGLTVFCDLASEEELFQGTGDYQFDIYRQMKAENSNSWTGYHPHSNVLWLHYLADKLLHGVRYKKKASTPSLRHIKTQLTKFHKEVLTFESAQDALQNSSLFQ